MPFTRPTLAQLRNASAQQLNASLPGADALLRFSNLAVIADVDAGLACMLYGYLDWIALQCTPFTATDEYLEGWGALKNITRKPCAQATGSITFTGTSGYTIIEGVPINRSDGVAYVSTSAGEVVNGSVTITAQAVADPAGLVGANGNCPAGTQFTLANAIAGIDSTGTAATDFTGGADIEENDAYRARVLLAYQNQPQGGDSTDYVEWALGVPGVTRAWSTPNGMGAGTVVVYIMLDVANAAEGGFPQGTNGCAAEETRAPPATGDQLTVANAIWPVQPVTALVYVCAPTSQKINVAITGIAVEYQAEVNAALAAQLQADGAPGGEVIVAHLWSAVLSVPGVNDFIITAPTVDIKLPTGALPVLGTVTYS
ncbi:baseplate J/gp47 family protein [Paraburkholderia sp. HD33-4]|uniref:baseplate J/gp47 family protein n=1 Tax=Paraburkholderia sp. HD33-4 TaxID=2883242 RepID=UPI001F34E302|nr:baseplate J/gp47 family protein [Paraburkholderia sp. HD33-4]